jgi:hypothetical protein
LIKYTIILQWEGKPIAGNKKRKKRRRPALSEEQKRKIQKNKRIEKRKEFIYSSIVASLMILMFA